MAHRIFVSHSGQGDASAAYGYSTATKNKACQIVKKKNPCKQSLPLRPRGQYRHMHIHKDVRMSTPS